MEAGTSLSVWMREDSPGWRRIIRGCWGPRTQTQAVYNWWGEDVRARWISITHSFLILVYVLPCRSLQELLVSSATQPTASGSPPTATAGEPGTAPGRGGSSTSAKLRPSQTPKKATARWHSPCWNTSLSFFPFWRFWLIWKLLKGIVPEFGNPRVHISGDQHPSTPNWSMKSTYDET